MATDKQIQANRLNAQHSTGPRSVEGKAASSQNALQSGIEAESQIIRGEDPTALAALTNDYLLEYQPRFASERALVDILIDTEWLLRRLRKAEAQLWERQFEEIESWHAAWPNQPMAEESVLGRAFSRAEQTFARLERRRDTLQRAFRRTLLDLRQIQASRPPMESQPAILPSPPAHPPHDPEIGFVPKSPAPCAPVSRLDPNHPVTSADFAQALQKIAQRRPESKRRPATPASMRPNNAARPPENAA
jgi:hypothetical protein